MWRDVAAVPTLQQEALTMSRPTTALLALALCLLPWGSQARADFVTTFDANADFEAGWIAGTNPNGVWRYGWTRGIDGPLTLFTRSYAPAPNGNLLHMWDDPSYSAGFTPSVARNPLGFVDDGNVTYQPGVLVLHG